jgi:hypothetical protein
MQSHDRSTKQGRKPLPLPHGHGSMAFHGTKWWLIYRDAKDKKHYENSGTDDAREARKIMAERALPRARAAVAELERIANEEIAPKTGAEGHGEDPSRDREEHASSGRTVRRDAARRGDNRKGNRGGKN